MNIQKIENFNEILLAIQTSKQKDCYLELTHDI